MVKESKDCKVTATLIILIARKDTTAHSYNLS